MFIILSIYKIVFKDDFKKSKQQVGFRKDSYIDIKAKVTYDAGDYRAISKTRKTIRSREDGFEFPIIGVVEMGSSFYCISITFLLFFI